MTFKVGDKVRRKADKCDAWWAEACKRYTKTGDVDQVLTVSATPMRFEQESLRFAEWPADASAEARKFELADDGWALARHVAHQIKYKDWVLNITLDGDRAYYQWAFKSPDPTKPGHPLTDWTSRKWFLSQHMGEGELVQTAFMAALTAEEHETREQFFYEQDRPFQPHVDFNAMRLASRTIEVRKEAGEAPRHVN